MALHPLNEEEITEIHHRLEELESEHRDLDQVISQLGEQAMLDQLLIQRLKKRKLVLKDKMLALEKMLVPDIPA